MTDIIGADSKMLIQEVVEQYGISTGGSEHDGDSHFRPLPNEFRTLVSMLHSGSVEEYRLSPVYDLL